MLNLTSDQSSALNQIFEWLQKKELPYFVVGGYAGTGKTTLIGYLRQELSTKKEWKGKHVAFCSFTGKATSVLRQKLKEAKALLSEDSCSTIHSLIYKPILDKQGQVIGWDRTVEVAADLIIIDEGSMVNSVIWADLRSFGKPILVFGDHGQLPPVEGSFYLMEGAHVRLEKIVRQAEGNPIIQLSHQVRSAGAIPFGSSGSVKKYSLQDGEAWDVFESIASGPADSFMCICGTNRTRIGLNKRIRQLHDFESEEPSRGDRVICLKNNHAKAIYNGMLGTIESIQVDEKHWYEMVVNFDEQTSFEGRVLKYQFNQPKTLREGGEVRVPVHEREFGDLFDFGYALTAHKAQGSEADRVIVFEERMRQYDEAMWRRWLYTAVTRAKNELIIFA